MNRPGAGVGSWYPVASKSSLDRTIFPSETLISRMWRRATINLQVMFSSFEHLPGLISTSSACIRDRFEYVFIWMLAMTMTVSPDLNLAYKTAGTYWLEKNKFHLLGILHQRNEGLDSHSNLQ